jgi:hypothetical protein
MSNSAAARVKGFKREGIEAKPEALLDYLARRLFDAPRGVASQLSRGGIAVHGKIEAAEVKYAVAQNPDDPEVAPELMTVSGKKTLYMNVVSLAVDAWFVEAGRPTGVVKVVWPQRMAASSASFGSPPVGTEGIAVLQSHLTTGMGRELAAGIPQSLGIDENGVFFIEDLAHSREGFTWWRDASKLTGDKLAAEAGTAAASSQGVKRNLALAALVKAGPAAIPVVEKLVAGAGKDLTSDLLYRATLWRLGARDKAVSGLGIGTKLTDAVKVFDIQIIPNEDGSVGSLIGVEAAEPLVLP